jgi:hypothetical protein
MYVLLATHFLSLRHLPAIGAGAPVRLIRLRSRIGLDRFYFGKFCGYTSIDFAITM